MGPQRAGRVRADTRDVSKKDSNVPHAPPRSITRDARVHGLERVTRKALQEIGLERKMPRFDKKLAHCAEGRARLRNPRVR
jgi:hypothetical protein